MDNSTISSTTRRRRSDWSLGGASSRRGMFRTTTTTGYRAGGGRSRAWASMGLGYFPTIGGEGARGHVGGGQRVRLAASRRSRLPSAAFGRSRITQGQPQTQHHNGALSSAWGDTSNNSLPHSTERSCTLPGPAPFPLNNKSKDKLDNGISAAWYIVAYLVCPVYDATYNLCIKMGSEFIHPVWGGVILQFVAALAGAVLLVFLVWQGGAINDYIACLEDIFYRRFAVWAGSSLAAAEVLSLSVSALGLPASRSVPIVVAGSVAFGTAAGCVLLNEYLCHPLWVGLFFLAFQIGLLAAGPGHQLLDE